MLLVTALCLVILAGCGLTQVPDPTREDSIGIGGSSPEAVTENFFEDLGAALRDPALGDKKQRDRWVEQLAGYFAPNEREDQRQAIESALAGLATGRSQLDPDQSMTLELHFDGVARISGDNERALVRLDNASISMMIMRTTDRGGVIVEYEQQVGLEQIIGRADGAVPVVKVGEHWFLTEG